MNAYVRYDAFTRKIWLAYITFLTIVDSKIYSGSSFTYAFASLRHEDRRLCVAKHFCKSPDDDKFEFADDNDPDGNSISYSNGLVTNLDMKEFQLRKHKLTLQRCQQQWHQPPNPLLEDPIEFVQAILMALQQRKNHGIYNGALCLLRSSTPSWRRTLLNSVGAPSNATNDQVAPSLQIAIERPNNQFAILTKNLLKGKIDENNFSTAVTAIEKCWHFPSEPVIFESDDDEEKNNKEECEKVIEFCWVESRLRSPEDDKLLVVVGWSLQRRQFEQEEERRFNPDNSTSNTTNSSPCWFLDGIDWQDFRDEFRPGIGREEWERICG